MAPLQWSVHSWLTSIQPPALWCNISRPTTTYLYYISMHIYCSAGTPRHALDHYLQSNSITRRGSPTRLMAATGLRRWIRAGYALLVAHAIARGAHPSRSCRTHSAFDRSQRHTPHKSGFDSAIVFPNTPNTLRLSLVYLGTFTSPSIATVCILC